ncbi:MAG: DUF4142 domain-containing protein [Gemmatirosa sp.]|nr:DUF4142 domain-containing protein [Gemmatirosa sp.]
MRFSTRFGTALLVGATCTLGACKKGDTAADSVATAMTTTDSAAGTTAAANDSALGAAPAGASMSAANIMSMIGLSNAAEIAAGKTAQDKATDADVKAFAKQMVADHQAMQKSGDSLATAKGVAPQPPPQADQKRQSGDQMLQTLGSTPKGADFDKAYVDGQVQAHQQVLNELQGYSSTAPDPDLKAMIDRAIPQVQQHLDKAQQLQQKLGAAPH